MPTVSGGTGIEVEGLRELRRSLGRADRKGLDASLRQAHKKVAKDVEGDVRSAGGTAQQQKALQTQREPLVLKAQGSFYVGGESVKQSSFALIVTPDEGPSAVWTRVAVASGPLMLVRQSISVVASHVPVPEQTVVPVRAQAPTPTVHATPVALQVPPQLV